MANLNKQISSSDFAATKSETSLGSGFWFDSMVGWNKKKDAEIQEEDNNIGFSVDTVPTCGRTEKVRTLE